MIDHHAFFNDYTLLAFGIAFAAVGGELFVRGVVTLARWSGVSAGVVGATVAAFATSSPELTVSVTAAIAGTPQIALGDALGSNVVNVAVILGLVLSISAIRTPRREIRRDFLVALVAPAITGILLLDGALSRLDAALMLSLFGAWLIAVIIEARQQRRATTRVAGAHGGVSALLLSVFGLALLVLAGRFIVTGASHIAGSFGIDPFLIGATVVALGTSTPEIATAVIAKLRGHDEVSLGTILGSNIFNGLFIVPIAAMIATIPANMGESAVALAFGMGALAAIYPNRTGVITRGQGVLLVVLYLFYLFAITVLQRAHL